MELLRLAIKEILLENFKVRGYIKPASAFYTLREWETMVNILLEYQRMGVDTRKQEIPPELESLIMKFFDFQINQEIPRYDLLTWKNVTDFIEDFVNHKFWAMKKQYKEYVPNIDSLKFTHFYSRGDLEPYVLLDDEWTNQLYGSLHIEKTVQHFTTEEGLQNLINSIESGKPFDISCFTTAHQPFFDAKSNLQVTLKGHVRAAFRSDVKSFATDSGRRAMNLHRLDYPGDDLTNICYDLSDCEPNRTSLWNELIVTPVEILSVEPIQ